MTRNSFHTDKFVRKLFMFLVPIVFILFIVTPLLTISIIFIYPTNTNELILQTIRKSVIILRGYMNFPLIPSVVQAFPIIVGAVVYKTREQLQLNLSGKVSLIILLIGAIITFSVIIYIKSLGDESLFPYFDDGKSSLPLLQVACEQTLTNCITYLFLLINFKPKAKSNS